MSIEIINECWALSKTNGSPVTKPKEKRKSEKVGGVVLQTTQLINFRIIKV